MDGGGTKTELIVVSENGKTVDRRVAGSSNPNDLGKERAVALLKELVESAIPKDATHVDAALGISGAAFSGADREIERELRSIERIKSVTVCSDVQIALDTAYEADGAIVIMGTGSVGYVRVNGQSKLVGGGGYMLDASLSGYDLGREVLNAALAAVDGRGEKTLLNALIEEKGIGSLREIVRDVYVKGKFFVASFAPLVFKAYRQGDLVATEILQKCVKDFEKLLCGLLKVGGGAASEITLFGGVSKEWDVLSKFLCDGILEKISFKVCEYPPVFGAVRLAKGSPLDEAFLSTISKTYAEIKN